MKNPFRIYGVYMDRISWLCLVRQIEMDDEKLS